ncbi:hypothetical protein A3K72_01815 [Candidatus Woesearchaeota archaeon RBG_13_36_6]|nr:MAG: hypothetical protein A3K72_01815 [Candidatus Woesearchaeota archaeon RBG_13_36_6]
MHSKKGLIFVLLTAIISGFSIFINKFGVTEINPYLFTWLKNTVVAIFLLSILIFFKDYKALFKLTKKQWSRLALIGLFGGSIPFLLFFKGLQLTSAASGGFIHKTMFIWVGVLALIFLKEKLNKQMFLAAILLLLGNLLLLQMNSFNIGLGEVLIFLATIFWSIETILSKNALKNLDAKTVAFGRMFFGSLFILVFLVLTGNITTIVSLNMSHVYWVLLTSVFLFFYVFTWYNGLKTISPTVATSILLLGSPITTLLNFIFLDNIVTITQVCGITLIGLGIAYAIYFLELNTQRISIANPR